MVAANGRRHLERVAAGPRPAGSEREADARRYCAEVLAALDFTVTMQPFEYSAAPGRWATPAGGIVSMLALVAAARFGLRDDARGALLVLLGTIVIGAPLALWTARSGILTFPFVRRHGVNLVALRSDAPPKVWLVAHLDSKSQPVPTAVRAGGIVLSAAVWIAAVAVAGAQWGGFAVGGWWPYLVGAGVAAGVPVAASIVGERSHGALDNASGVATVLAAAEQLGAGIGVLLTSGEELGLAGARAWAAAHPRGLALNCDGVDDGGALICMRSRGASRSRAVAAFVAGAAQCNVGLQVRGLVPGLLVDAVALSDAGWDAATLSRGNWKTLARVHSRRDDLEHLTGSGIVEAAAVMAAAAASLCTDSIP